MRKGTIEGGAKPRSTRARQRWHRRLLRSGPGWSAGIVRAARASEPPPLPRPPAAAVPVRRVVSLVRRVVSLVRRVRAHGLLLLPVASGLPLWRVVRPPAPRRGPLAP